MKITISLLLGALLFTACDLIKYHPYEMDEDSPRGLTTQNISLIEPRCAGHDTLRFIFMTDTQRQYDHTRDAVDQICRMPDIDFVLHGGDLTDFGLADEFKWMTEELCRLNAPWVTVIGNHDFLGVGEHNYMRIYGDYNWSFNAGHTHIVGLNTNSREQEYSIAVPDFNFLQADINSVDSLNHLCPDSITRTIVLMHSHPGDEQFNSNVVLPFGYFLRRYPGLSVDGPRISPEELLNWPITETDRQAIAGSYRQGFALTGHTHHHDLRRLLDDDLLFYECPDIKKREVYLFTLYPDCYTYEPISF